ncbi:MAG: DNA polymerase III subunit delta [Chloroflexota bacterium]|nr:DNA polymerase III subunit delta [Deltaproteobacteria bacterium]MDE2969226.1 DNA polymerase III subunit delta [Chloroflexota bacterium]
MIYLLHGQDTYSLREFLDSLREAVGMPDVRDANITTLSASEAVPDTLVNMCQAMPFLAERRMVIVEGLLGSLSGEGGRGRGRGGGGQRAAEWGERIAGMADAMPPTTDLVFVEGQLRPNHPLMRDLSAVAAVREFTPLNQNELRGWVQARVMASGGSMTTQAVQLLVDLVGPDLWALSSEVEKLTLYASGRAVTAEDVEELVVSAREVSVFTMVDAVLEGNRDLAMRSLNKQLEGDATVSYLLAMLARQVRLMVLAKDLLAQQVPQNELGGRLGIASAYPLRKTLEMARRFSPDALKRLHRGLLETDFSIKTGAMPERLALEYLVAEVCQRVSRGAAARR